ncbi:MAG: DUF2887 domain-containing protein [Microcystis aeruginosa Ma_QC_B_20070730_S2]|uniref:DUF2887 domain-containing protein n=1 Tax=Microcystis aeruginosa Ma_QC_B_20070730_S2 TaxID=2486256 RepID=A0A552DBP7_MICAE|nr:MAG: DUF2887 domain-containing protein [Microcystis aeruginosa Ma_QC_B_20070730_S2]
MKTDTIFYQLFQSFPSIFFELIQPTFRTLVVEIKSCF